MAWWASSPERTSTAPGAGALRLLSRRRWAAGRSFRGQAPPPPACFSPALPAPNCHLEAVGCRLAARHTWPQPLADPPCAICLPPRRLLSMCQSCHDQGEVLACSLPSADMVLVPRLPATAAQDGLYFLAYATNLKAVELCERLRQQKQVALVLDLGARACMHAGGAPGSAACSGRTESTLEEDGGGRSCLLGHACKFATVMHVHACMQ